MVTTVVVAASATYFSPLEQNHKVWIIITLHRDYDHDVVTLGFECNVIREIQQPCHKTRNLDVTVLPQKKFY